MFNRVLTTTARKPPLRRADRNPIALLKRARHALAMHLSAEQLAIASRIDAKMQRLADEGNDDVAIFVELADDMSAFRRLLDAGPHAMDQLCLWFGGVLPIRKDPRSHRAGIASGEIRVPK
jgi:hypothetical protein